MNDHIALEDLLEEIGIAFGRPRFVLVLPGVALGFLALFPQYNRVIPAPLPHFYVVTAQSVDVDRRSIDLIGRAQADGQGELRSRFVSNAKGAALRMTGLIDDMLSVSKIESGELKPQLQEVALAELLADRVGGFAAQAQAQEKALTFNCPPDVIVPLDPALIGRVVDNLISNAFKYTDERTGRIRVSGCTENGRVVVHVIDNGKGVPAAYQEKIFAKFVHAPDEKRSLRKGTGLGLAFCRLVVEAHNGEIKVQDAPGGGSDFVLWIPQ